MGTNYLTSTVTSIGAHNHARQRTKSQVEHATKSVTHQASRINLLLMVDGDKGFFHLNCAVRDQLNEHRP